MTPIFPAVSWLLSNTALRAELGRCGPDFINRGFRLCSGIRQSLSALFGALVLTQAFPPAAEAAPRTGVTVLVHGFTSFDGAGSSPYKYWGGSSGENLTALLERFGSGLVWEYDRATGNYINVTDSMSGGKYRIPRGQWRGTSAGQQILLFDWRAGSDEPEAGQAEAAADALFASLMKFRVDEKPIISASPYAALRPLHFIGHSRGTVVVSETVQRLGRYNIQVNYVTYLDIHDFGQPPPIAKDEFFHDPAVQVWENVDCADAFYQQNPANMCLVNPSGRRLSHIPMGPLQRDLTTETALLNEIQCGLHQRPHAWIKDYYWGTVATNGPSINRPARWYQQNDGDGTGKGFGFDRWLAQGGFNQRRDPTLNRVKCVVAAEAIPFVWNNNPVNDNGHPDRNDVPPVLFNGDFELPDLDRGISDTQVADTLAGWSFFGGGGSAYIRPFHVLNTPPPDNSYLVLSNTALVARHNRFFLPPEAREMRFAMAVPFVPNTPQHDHVLEVRIGNKVVRAFTVNETDGFEVRQVNLRNHPELLGGVNTLTFELFTIPHAVTLRTAVVRLDNVSIVTDPTSWVDSFQQENPPDWRLRWRSWPSGTFYLETSSNLIDWLPAQNSSIPSTSGSFIVPQNEAPQIYFRGRVVPAR